MDDSGDPRDIHSSAADVEKLKLTGSRGRVGTVELDPADAAQAEGGDPA